MNDNELRNALENIEIEDYLGILKLGKTCEHKADEQIIAQKCV